MARIQRYCIFLTDNGRKEQDKLVSICHEHEPGVIYEGEGIYLLLLAPPTLRMLILTCLKSSFFLFLHFLFFFCTIIIINVISSVYPFMLVIELGHLQSVQSVSNKVVINIHCH